jgi:hypothetical protein
MALWENLDLEQNVIDLCKMLHAYDLKISSDKSKALAMDRRNMRRIKLLCQDSNKKNVKINLNV